MSFAHQNDGELLARFVTSGEPGYFEELFRRHRGAILHVCRAALGRDDADDVLQAVFITLARRAAELTHLPSLAGWLARVAWHTALRQRRASLTRRRHEQRAATVMAQSRGDEVDPHLRDEIEFEVYKALDRLPESYREAIILHHLHGMTVEQCAGLLGSPTGTVAARLSRARDMLREKLKGQGYVVTLVALTAILEERPAAAAPSAGMPCVNAVLSQAAEGTGAGRLLGLCIHYPRLAVAATSGRTWLVSASAAVVVTSLFAAGAAAGYLARFGPGLGPAFSQHGRKSEASVRGSEPERQTTWAEEWSDFWSSSQPSGGGTSVPEPATASLLAVATLGLLRRRRVHPSRSRR